MDFSRTLAVTTSMLAGSLFMTCASAQGIGAGYVTDSRGSVVKSAYDLCYRTGSWTPAMATRECDADLLPKPAPVPATRPSSTPPPINPVPARPAAPAASAPAPVPAKPHAVARCDATVTLLNDQTFAFNKAALNSAAQVRLDKDIIGRAAQCAALDSVAIEGHADRLGSQQYNQKLSEKRADAVKAYLVGKGMPAGKMETIGMGKTVPAKSCPHSKNRAELIACLAPNRRAIITIKGPGK